MDSLDAFFSLQNIVHPYQEREKNQKGVGWHMTILSKERWVSLSCILETSVDSEKGYKIYNVHTLSITIKISEAWSL